MTSLIFPRKIRLLLDRARDLIIHGPTRHGDNHGVAMPTDKDDQYGHFLFNHLERKVILPPRRAQHCSYC